MTQINETSIPFIKTGEAGSTILFSHANGYPPGCYRSLLARLGQKYQVFSMLSRPLWPDSKPADIKDWMVFSNDLLTFMDQEGLNSVIAIGHSLGGITSLRSAILKPQKFRALILIDPVLFSPSHIFLRRLIRSQAIVYRFLPIIKTAQFRRREFSDLSLAFRAFRRKNIFRYMKDEYLRDYVNGIVNRNQNGGYDLSFSPEWEMKIYATGIWRDMDIWKRLSTLNIPILIIRGAETDTFLSPAAKLFKKYSPNSKIITLEKTTHLIPLENPEEVGNSIFQFLEEIL